MPILPALLFTLLLPATALQAAEVYQTADAFLAEAFSGQPPEPATLWLKNDIQESTSRILGHNYPALRVRYWFSAPRSAWILEEIGKEQPISVGLVVSNGALERVRVLEFRESRGWEVHYPFFTDQFNGAGLTADGMLDRNIDGISGATLSVRAVQKLARLALYFHSRIPGGHDAPAQD